VKAAEKLELVHAARDDVFSMATNAQRNGTAFASPLLRRCMPEPVQ